MNQLIYQLKVAWANLEKKQGFVFTVVTTMGLTLGALLCVVTLADLLLLKPLPYPDQERLYQVDHARINGAGEMENPAFNYPGLIELYKNQSVFSQAGLIYYDEGVMTSHPAQPLMSTGYVTPEWFSMLAVPMAMGRAFELSERLDSHNPVAILSDHSWRSQFAADPNIIGQKVSFNGVSFSIVGVTAQHFVEPEIFEVGETTGVWLPWDYNIASPRLRKSWRSSNSRQLFVGKLKLGLSALQAGQTLTPAASSRWQSEVVGIESFQGKHIEIKLNDFQSVILGDSKQTVVLLLAGIMGLVLIAGANIANLFMSRTAEQQHQLAIHAVVGARKNDIFKNLLAESGLLMFFSIILALVVAVAGFAILQHFLAEVLPRVSELSMNGVTLIVAVVVGLLLALFFARLSSNMLDYRVLNAILQSSGKGTGFQVSKGIRQLLITSQVAIATLLVFININLLQHSLDEIIKPLGFNVDNVAYLELSNAAATTLTSQQNSEMLREIRRKIAQLPQVAAVSQSTSVLSDYRHRLVKADDHYRVLSRDIDEHYFSLIDQPMLQGDHFTAADIRDGNKVVIVNNTLAKRLAPQGSAIGTKLQLGKDYYRVIGVVRAVKMPGKNNHPISTYWPSAAGDSDMLIKLKANQQLAREDVINAIKQVSSVYSVYDLEMLTDKRTRMLFSQITTAVTTTVLAVLTFFLTAIGLYGVLSYATQMRRFELGTRMAIGAKGGDLIVLIIKDNATGIGLGIVISFVTIVLSYLGFTDSVANYINWQLLPNALVTLALIAAITLFTCYWPLRVFIHRPVIYSLKG